MKIIFNNINEIENFSQYLVNNYGFDSSYTKKYSTKVNHYHDIEGIMFRYPNTDIKKPYEIKGNYYFLCIDVTNNMAYISWSVGNYDNIIKNAVEKWEINNEDDILLAIEKYENYKETLEKYNQELNSINHYNKYVNTKEYKDLINNYKVINETDDKRKEKGILKIYFSDLNKTIIMWPNGYIRVYNGNSIFSDSTRTTMKKLNSGDIDAQFKYVNNYIQRLYKSI